MVLMLVLATGGHWAMLQSVAWFGMAIQFSQREPLTSAIGKTFSGEHPCQLCKAVSEGVKNEKQQKAQKLEAKFDFFCCHGGAWLDVPCPEALPVYAATLPHSRLDSPPVPPPKFA